MIKKCKYISLIVAATLLLSLAAGQAGAVQVSFMGRLANFQGGVVASITTDALGNIYVSDRLRTVVLIFNDRFNFRTEFGYRGFGPGSLIVPDDVIADDEKGLIYVAQAANRGLMSTG